MLFDTGASDAVVRNAERLKVDLLNLDYIVLSHGHNDHTGGLYHLLRLFLEAIVDGTAHRLPRFIAHPHCFYPRPKPPLPDIGAVLSADSVRRFVPLEPHGIALASLAEPFLPRGDRADGCVRGVFAGLAAYCPARRNGRGGPPARRHSARLSQQRRARDRHGVRSCGDLQHGRARPQGLRGGPGGRHRRRTPPSPRGGASCEAPANFWEGLDSPRSTPATAPRSPRRWPWQGSSRSTRPGRGCGSCTGTGQRNRNP